MKSRISIDVDYDNQPIIKIDYEPSDDVRDKLVKKFLETLGGHCWALFYYENHRVQPDGNHNKISIVRPLKLENLKDEWPTMKKAAEDHEERMRMAMESAPVGMINNQ